MSKITNTLKTRTARACKLPLRIFEVYFLQCDYSDPRSELAPVFIIGAPRTGSTILYQSLTNAYSVQYIDNLSCLWSRNLLFGLWLSQIKHGEAPHNNFKATRGDTSQFGSNAPSECGEFWYRWLPRDRHFINFSEIKNTVVREIKREVNSISNFFQKPLLFKNLNAGQRLRLISSAFPDAKIIFVRRDPRFVVRSILRARNEANIKPKQWWSIMPPNVQDLKSLPEDEMCAAQVYYLEKQIKKDLRLFNKNNVKTVHFQDFNERLVVDIAQWLELSPRQDGDVPSFRADDIADFDADELRKVEHVVSDYPFEQELFR